MDHEEFLDQLGDLRAQISNKAREPCNFFDKFCMDASTKNDGGQKLESIIE